jgi:hypothetical protein
VDRLRFRCWIPMMLPLISSGLGQRVSRRPTCRELKSRQTDDCTPVLTQIVSKIVYPPEASRRNPFYSLTNFTFQDTPVDSVSNTRSCL